MATTECRTTVRGLDVYDDSSLPAQLRLITPEVASQWRRWSCAVTGTLRVRKRGRKIECIRVSVVSTIVDEIAPAYSSTEDLYKFGALLSTFGRARRNEIFLHVVLQGGEQFTACRIDVKCDLPPSVPSRYSPILINALPRSGTTWLASLLAQHPEIVVHPRYPFEVRQSVYWMSLLRILTNPYNNHRERREMRFLVDRDLTDGSPSITRIFWRSLSPGTRPPTARNSRSSCGG